MKTVTIPTCANPFVVIVNGIKYTYPAGATVEVPDDVAEVIEQHEEAKTEPAPVQPPYSGDDILAAANAYTDKKVAEGGGGGLEVEVVELTTMITNGATFTTDENARLTAAWNTGKPVIIKCQIDLGHNLIVYDFIAQTMRGVMSHIVAVFAISFGSTVYQIGSYLIEVEGAQQQVGDWFVQTQTV